MSEIKYQIAKSNNLTRCKLLKAKRLGRGPGSNYGKLSGRGMNGQKSKESVPISQATKQWRLSHPKVFIMKKRSTMRNPRFVITNNMLRSKKLHQVALLDICKELSDNISNNLKLRKNFMISSIKRLVANFINPYKARYNSPFAKQMLGNIKQQLSNVNQTRLNQNKKQISASRNVSIIEDDVVDSAEEITTDILTNKTIAQNLSFETVKKIVKKLLNNIVVPKDISFKPDEKTDNKLLTAALTRKFRIPQDLSFEIISAIFNVPFQYKQIRILQNNNKTIILNSYNVE